ncbi:winged helix-turn-helix domain-containing protein [Paracoccus marcusii]|uniref:response regulator transcription factor n=1 Tax=Paracoccus marcusii TaxID=59779 RepID=UPI0012EF017E
MTAPSASTARPAAAPWSRSPCRWHAGPSHEPRSRPGGRGRHRDRRPAGRWPDGRGLSRRSGRLRGGAGPAVAGRGYDLVVLDRMLPDGDGADLCQEIRAAGHDVMILMLTAKDALAEKLEGWGGADDYMTKPFAFEELLARIAVLLRRAPAREDRPSRIVIGDLCLDLDTKTATRRDRDLDLTATEFSLLRFLAERPDKVQSSVDILKGVWGYNFDPQTNIVEVYIAYLRKKLDQDGDARLIHNQRGFGYLLSAR